MNMLKPLLDQSMILPACSPSGCSVLVAAVLALSLGRSDVAMNVQHQALVAQLAPEQSKEYNIELNKRFR